MRQSQKNNRSRNKNGRKSNGPSPNRVYESNGPEGKVRGTPQQIIEKYQSLSRDKFTAGDRILAESYLQFAEHYTRILNAAQPRREEREEEAESAADEAAGGVLSDEVGDGPAKSRPANGAAPEGLAVIGDEETSDIVATPESLSERRRPPRRRADPAGADDDEETKRPRRRVGRKPKADSPAQSAEPEATQTEDAAPAAEEASAAPESPAQVLI